MQLSFSPALTLITSAAPRMIRSSSRAVPLMSWGSRWQAILLEPYHAAQLTRASIPPVALVVAQPPRRKARVQGVTGLEHLGPQSPLQWCCCLLSPTTAAPVSLLASSSQDPSPPPSMGSGPSEL
ncbi:hypothetical protein NDU88_003088 [Pleurodeles waltl]|uniref:Uncharacterized protein n=1 Tax=Pleurodeles waltl TaxID=8319 RepID=A0AAV7M3D9_PLEWA|nr:hypothetical protein NDU88_003088 [Pleurodeles waltl]